MDQTLSRVTAFCVVFIVFLLSGIVTDNIVWAAHSTLSHSLIQSVATVIALFCGIAAIYRFYTGQPGNNMLLFIGVGFMGTFLIDIYHTVVTASWFQHAFPLIPPTVAEWSWFATRAFLSVLLILSLPSISGGAVNPRTTYTMVVLLTIMIFVVFMLLRTPYPVYPENFIARPLEFIPGGLFILAFIGYVMKGGWKTDKFEFWMVLFLISSIACDLFFMDLSKHAHDLEYLVAHVMKIVGYAMVYFGITSKQ